MAEKNTGAIYGVKALKYNGKALGLISEDGLQPGGDSPSNGDERVVHLEGEAYFEVAKNHSKPFIVKLKNQQITVLGTSFNIQAFNDDRFSVTTLLSGSIQLHYF